MELSRVRCQGFRNLESLEISLSPGVNVFLGQNGQGKTNFLEMVYFLSSLKSFRGAKTRDLIEKGRDRFVIEAQVESQGLDLEAQVTWSPQGRVAKLNGSRLDNLLDYFSKLRAVCFSPEDLAIVQGSPSERRRFLDRLVFQCKPKHLFTVSEFTRVLKQRNALLKKLQMAGKGGGGNDGRELSVWNEKFLAISTHLTEARLEFLREINHLLVEEYGRVCGKEQEAGVLRGPVHLLRLAKEGVGDQDALDLPAIYRAYENQMKKMEVLERDKGVSLWGPHLDDFVPFYGDSRADLYASMGQQKTLLLALRLSELKLVTKYFGEPPLLLLDDLSGELDQDRLKTLISHLAASMHEAKKKMQTLITTVSLPFQAFQSLGDLHGFEVQSGKMNRREMDSTGQF